MHVYYKIYYKEVKNYDINFNAFDWLIKLSYNKIRETNQKTYSMSDNFKAIRNC